MTYCCDLFICAINLAILPFCEKDGMVKIKIDIGRQFYSPGSILLFGDAPAGPRAGFVQMRGDSMRLHVGSLFLWTYFPPFF